MSQTITKPIIFLPIENTVRELDYKVNLARLFCHAGFDAIIGNPPFIRDELKYKNYKGVFLEKGVNPDPPYYENLAKKRIYLYDLGDEGCAEPVYAISYEPAIDSLKKMRKIFLWGESQREELFRINSDLFLQEKYSVIGNPGYDLCTSKYKPFNIRLKPQNLPDTYILINTNFGCINSYSMDEHLRACNLISPSSKDMMKEGYEKEKSQWPVFQEWLETIITSFPEENFLIRPHPTEISENYEKIFGKYKNVLISKEGNVNYVTAAAKLVLHKDCSTAMQAYLMGIPSISLGGSTLKKGYIQWPLQFSFSPDTIDEANKLISGILKNGRLDHKDQETIDQQAKKTLGRYFSNIGDSTRALVDTILEDSRALKEDLKPYKLIDQRSLCLRLKMLVRRWLPLHYKVPIVARETMLSFTKRDVYKRLELLEQIDSTGCRFKVKKIFPNTFRISKL